MPDIDYRVYPKICKARAPLRLRWPDVIIGENEDPYLLRWYILPKNPIFNIYLHKFVRSDDDRALHDHPWTWNASLIISGEYIEHMPLDKATYGTDGDFRTITKLRRPFRPIFRKGSTPHRVELMKTVKLGKPILLNVSETPVWTLFITGSREREWGFYCPQGWKHWEKFVSKRDGGNAVGEGCGE